MKKHLLAVSAALLALSLGFVSCSGDNYGRSPNSNDNQTVSVTGVSINKNAMTIDEGEQEKLTATVLPDNATNKEVAWQSSNTTIATVSTNGTVTGIAPGIAVITVNTQDGNRTDNCIVTVSSVTQPIGITNITLNKNTMSLAIGIRESLIPSLLPLDATNQNITWDSANQSIAMVSNGEVLGISPGTTTITATTQDGGHKAPCTVTVLSAPKPVTNITLDRNTMTLAVGDTTGTLVPAITPIDATNQNISWTSSSANVAAVSNNGIVTARAVGKTIITATAANSSIKAECEVTVVAQAIPHTDAYPNKYNMTLSAGVSEPFIATFVPSEATDQNIVWTSSDPTVAVVSSTGVVTALKAGTVEINAGYSQTTTPAIAPSQSIDNPIVKANGINPLFHAPLRVTVAPQAVRVTGVALNETISFLTVGNTEALIPTIYPSNATNQAVNWISSNNSVAVVSSSGVVTALSVGTAAITVGTRDGGYMATCTVIVTPAKPDPIHPTGVTLNKISLSLDVGNAETLIPTVLPENADNKNVYWNSSNDHVAVVSSNGLVTAVAQGTAIITVATQDGGKTATCAVTVSTAPISVTGVSLNKTTATLTVGGSETLTAAVQPNNATNKTVSWASSNTNVVTVSNGIITGIAAGTATITVTTQDGNKVATCSVTVIPDPVPVTSIILNKDSIILAVGNQETLTATIQPANATNKVVTWSSKNTAVATVNNGAVTAIAPGTARITATTHNNLTAYCDVTVNAAPIAVTGVTLNKNSLTIEVGKSETLTATIAPSNATNKTVTWSSNNTSVATVNTSGLVTAIAAGSARITVTTQDGNKTATCDVTVTAPPTVYVAGSEEGRPTLWINGQALPLNNQGAFISDAHSISVANNGTVYVMGTGRKIAYDAAYANGLTTEQAMDLSNNYFYSVSRLWTVSNGAVVQTRDFGTDGSEVDAKSVFVADNGDVHLAGTISQYELIYMPGGGPRVKDLIATTPTMWKNGSATTLSYASYDATANSVSVADNGDVYVAGTEGMSAKLWRVSSGGSVESIDLEYFSALRAISVNSVFASGSKVYVAGTGNYSVPKPYPDGQMRNYWATAAMQWTVSDGVLVDTKEFDDAGANSVFVFDDDVYMAGYGMGFAFDPTSSGYPPEIRKAPVVWGALVEYGGLHIPEWGRDYEASSVCVTGTNVYVVGTINDNAYLWVNGVARQLNNDGTWASANSVAVK